MTARRKRTKPPVDPALIPFLDAIAEMLVAQEERLAESRRRALIAACDFATHIKSPTRTTHQGDKDEIQAHRAKRRKK